MPPIVKLGKLVEFAFDEKLIVRSQANFWTGGEQHVAIPQDGDDVQAQHRANSTFRQRFTFQGGFWRHAQENHTFMQFIGLPVIRDVCAGQFLGGVPFRQQMTSDQDHEGCSAEQDGDFDRRVIEHLERAQARIAAALH